MSSSSAVHQARAAAGAKRPPPAFPPTVIRGEMPDGVSDLSVGVDWLRFSFRPATVGWVELVMSALSLAGVPGGFKQRKRGMWGYECSGEIGTFGLVAWGGLNMNGVVTVELNSGGCTVVRDWAYLAGFLSRVAARITRCDLRLDDFGGDRFNVEWARAAFRAGGFAGKRRPPKSHFVSDEGSGEGCTYYVGSRVSGKLFRCYEKGRQLGRVDDPWVRVEVEWLAKDRVIPVAILLHPLRFLAGSYPCLSHVWAVAESVRTVRKAAVLSLGALVHHARQQAGRIVNVLAESFDGDLGRVVSVLRRDGRPARLDPASVLGFISGLYEGGLQCA